MTLLGHLGAKVSDLLDDRLGEAEAASAWAHVDACPACQQLVETESWVKQTLGSLGHLCGDDHRAPDRLRGRLSDDALIASYADAAGWVNRPTPPDQRRHRWTLAAIGGGAVGAAVLGIVALGAAPAQAPVPERRVPVTANVRVSDNVRTTPASPSPARTASPASPSSATAE